MVKVLCARFRVGLAALAVGVLIAAGCSSSDSGADTTPAADGTVSAMEKDFEITLSSDTASAGAVQFAIMNEGPSAHEFVVVKSDLAPDALPVVDGQVSEDGLDVIGEEEDVAPGTAPTLDVTLEAGSYIIMCDIVARYQQGMHVGFTVA